MRCHLPPIVRPTLNLGQQPLRLESHCRSILAPEADCGVANTILCAQVVQMMSLSPRDDVLHFLKRGCAELRHQAPALRADREVVIAAVEWDGCALQYAAPALREDRDVVLAAIKQNGNALHWVSHVLYADPDVMLAAIKWDGCALEYAAPALRANRNFVLVAVKQDGWALQYAAPALREDRDVVLAAVKQDGTALICCDEFKADCGVVLAAVKQNGNAFEYAALALRVDLQIVLAAVKLDGAALKFASDELQADSWLQRLSKRPKLSRFGQAVFRYLQDTKDAKNQAKVDLFLIKHDDGALMHWIDSCSREFKLHKRQRLNEM